MCSFDPKMAEISLKITEIIDFTPLRITLLSKRYRTERTKVAILTTFDTLFGPVRNAVYLTVYATLGADKSKSDVFDTFWTLF